MLQAVIPTLLPMVVLYVSWQESTGFAGEDDPDDNNDDYAEKQMVLRRLVFVTLLCTTDQAMKIERR